MMRGMMSILNANGVLYGIYTLAPPARVTGHVVHVPSAFRVKRGRGQRRNRRNAGWRKPNRRLSPSELEQSLAKLREMATAWVAGGMPTSPADDLTLQRYERHKAELR